MKKQKPANCFTCQYPVHEFEDDKHGCDNCGAIWVFEDGAWRDVTKKKTKKERNYGNN